MVDSGHLLAAPALCTFQEISIPIDFMAVWAGAGVDASKKLEISAVFRKSNLDSSVFPSVVHSPYRQCCSSPIMSMNGVNVTESLSCGDTFLFIHTHFGVNTKDKS
jgi:hypothetical protein